MASRDAHTESRDAQVSHHFHISEPRDLRWDVLVAIAEVTRLALERGDIEIAKSWTVAQETICHPRLIATPRCSNVECVNGIDMHVNAPCTTCNRLT